MIAFDYTVLIQIVAFLVFWFLLTKLLFKPFIDLLEQREHKTEGTKSEAAALKEEGERLSKEYEQAIARVVEGGRAAKEKIVEEGRQAREMLLSQVRDEAARKVGAARAEIRKELEKGRALAGREAEAIARQMAEKILGRGIR